MDLWNVKDLKPPCIKTCKCKLKEIEIRILGITFIKAVEFFSNQQHLNAEAALLSRTIYRLKTKFRSSKDMKVIEKLNRLLRTYLEIKMLQKLEYVSRQIPTSYSVNQTSTLSKNLIDFILVKCQGLGKVLLRIMETSKIAAMWLQQKLRIGHFWEISLTLLAIVSRIFVIAKSILKYICEFFLNILPYSKSLGNTDVQWLPKDYTFPKRLDEWLEIDWDIEDPVIEIDDDNDTALSFFNLQDSDDELEYCGEYVLVKDDSAEFEEIVIDDDNSDVSRLAKEVEIDLTGDQSEVDIGEIINVSDVVEHTSSDIQNIQNTPKRGKKRKKSSPKKKFNKNLSPIRKAIPESNSVKKKKNLKNFTPKNKKQSGGSPKKKQKLNKKSPDKNNFNFTSPKGHINKTIKKIKRKRNLINIV